MENKSEDKPKKQFIIVKSLVTDTNGRILLVRRKREWHVEAHNKWEFPGGKVDFGEDPEHTAVREAKEESGYDVKVLKIIPKILTSQWEYPDRVSQQLLICYVCGLVGGNASTADHGVSEVRWFDVSEIPSSDDCLPGTTEFLEEYSKM
jgi:8-oxo-dGTP diphosphatase